MWVGAVHCRAIVLGYSLRHLLHSVRMMLTLAGSQHVPVTRVVGATG
jgi:hypothetical protein